MFDLTDRIALVTGSGRGLGFEMAKGLAGAGAHVLVNGRDLGHAADAVSQIQDSGGSAEALVFDVSEEDQRLSALASIEAAHGRLDILINNVGMRDRRSIDEISADDFQVLLQVNLTSVFVLAREAASLMRARGWGRIINMSALASALGLIHGPCYASSKGGLEALTRMLATALGRTGSRLTRSHPVSLLPKPMRRWSPIRRLARNYAAGPRSGAGVFPTRSPVQRYFWRPRRRPTSRVRC